MANIKIVERKKLAVEKLANEIEKAEIVLFTGYRGINVEQDTNLRKAIREANGTYEVVKNNIAKRACEKLNIEFDDEVFVGPTAVIIANEDYLGVLKVIYNFSKDNDFYILKSGLIESEIKSVEELQVLAKLPSREELLGMLAGTLLSTISKLAVAVNEVKNKKEEGSDAKEEEKVEEEKTEEPKEEEAKEEKAEEAKEEKTEEVKEEKENKE